MKHIKQPCNASAATDAVPLYANSLPPLPFTYVTLDAPGDGINTGQLLYVNVLDAGGRKIASLWGRPWEKIALAELICHAGNACREIARLKYYLRQNVIGAEQIITDPQRFPGPGRE